MKRSEQIFYGLIAVVVFCCLASLVLFDPRVKKALGSTVNPLDQPEPSRQVHAFVPDGGTVAPKLP